LYFPGIRYGFTEVERSTSYTDIAGLSRTVNVWVRMPSGAPVPMPVVIWSHGGPEGKNNPRNSLSEWGITTAEAGYLTINIAHPPRFEPPNGTSWPMLCAAMQPPLDGTACKNFKFLNWDRPHDIRAVLDELTLMNAQGPLRGQIDLTKIVLAGHSSGSSGVLSTLGALRQFGGPVLDLSDPLDRPIAALALSPQQPGNEGLFDTRAGSTAHSWINLDKPILAATGDGDSTCNPGVEPGSCVGETPYGRRIGFERMPVGNKYRFYVHDADAFHGLFSLSTHKCAPPGFTANQAKCDEMARWLKSSALAFLDAHARGSNLAQNWLRSRNVETASGGLVEWSTK
jgi:hypothetical protein